MAAPEHPRTAVLLGASGATGQRLLPRLLNNPLYGKVVTVSRRETGITHVKLENRNVDFDNLAKGFVGLTIDDAYCTFGTTLKIIAQRSNRRWAKEMLFPLLPLLDKVLMGGLDKYWSIPVENL